VTEGATPTPPAGEPPAFADSHLATVKRLERDLASARKWSVKSTRQLHARMVKDVRDAERRARQAERRAVAAEERLARAQQRARDAEAEVAAVRASSTWRAGQVVVAVPARLKRWGRG
jgi:uncharacterized protein YlxW (UPF0749 family)